MPDHRAVPHGGARLDLGGRMDERHLRIHALLPVCGPVSAWPGAVAVRKPRATTHAGWSAGMPSPVLRSGVSAAERVQGLADGRLDGARAVKERRRGADRV